MSASKLQIRGDVQIQLAKVGYELRRLQKEIESLTLDRVATEAEQHALDHTQEALKGLRVAQDHAELVGFYLDEILDDELPEEP